MSESKKVPRARAKSSKTEEKVELKGEKELLPKGPAPTAVVQARHAREMIERPARGFSLGELSATGLSFEKAKSWKVSLDIRRKSILDGNVTKLKSWLPTKKARMIEKPVEPVKAKEEKPKEVKPKKQRKKPTPRKSAKKKG